MKPLHSDLLDEFRVISQELDRRNDKYERITKISRDITISSKRLISMLQRLNVQTSPEERSKCLKRAQDSDAVIQRDFLQRLAKELKGESHYYFNRACTFGLQEYLEAILFLKYHESKTFCGYEDILVSHQIFAAPGKNLSELPVAIQLTQTDYFLGVMDFTGELMRSVINVRQNSDFQYVYATCYLMQLIHQGITSLAGFIKRDLLKKTPVLLQSLIKVENFVYQLRIREQDAYCGPGKDFTLDLPELPKHSYAFDEEHLQSYVEEY